MLDGLSLFCRQFSYELNCEMLLSNLVIIFMVFSSGKVENCFVISESCVLPDSGGARM